MKRWMRAAAIGTLGVAIMAAASACGSESALVAGITDSHEFLARVRRELPVGTGDTIAARALSRQGFDCARTDTLQSDEADTLQSRADSEDPGTEYLTCDYVRRRRWGQNTRRRYLVVLYIREHRVYRVFAVTHLREVH